MLGETVTIDRGVYERLLEDSNCMEALEAAGVDNWEGYDIAMRNVVKVDHRVTPSSNKITRLEVIDHTKEVSDGGGRNFIFHNPSKQVHLSLQDDNRTLKLFVSDRDEN